MLKRILIIIGAVWVLEIFTVSWLDSTILIELFALIPAQVVGQFAIWQPATYMWLHSPTDFIHVLFNGLFLWMFGGSLELAWGPKAFLRFYLICGIGAGIIVLVSGLLFAPGTPVLGASGAIYGLVIAWAIAYPNRLIYFFGIFPMRGKHFVLIPIGFALVDFLTKAQGVSHAAHLGGMAIGALLVTGWWRPQKAKQQIRYWWLRRRLKVLEGEKRRRSEPPDGGYWH